MPPRALLLSSLVLLTAVGCGTPVTSIVGVAYDDRHGEATTLDVYLPEGLSTGSRPAVVMIHGGGWSKFSKQATVDQSTRLAEAGFVVASINYRLVPDGTYPSLIRDCYCALGFVEKFSADYGIDPTRIAVMGYSAGGHLASLLGATEALGDFVPDCGVVPSVRPAAVISGAGPQDMALLPEVDAVVDFLGGTASEVPERYRLASPLTHVSADDPPFLFIHGTADLFVDVEHSRAMARALREVGVETRELELRGGGHILNPGGDLVDAVLPVPSTDSPEAWAATIAFLDDTLGAP